jgi:hypothetical protein
MIRYMLRFLLGILLFNANAQATDINVSTNGNLDFNMGAASTIQNFFSVTHTESGTFTDVFEFSLASPGTENVPFAFYEGVTPISFDLYSSSGYVVTSGENRTDISDDPYYLMLGQLSAGSYYFKIVGPAAGAVADPYIASTYEFVDYVSPVPEPSTYALMLMGMLGIGYVLRRRARGTMGQEAFA